MLQVHWHQVNKNVRNHSSSLRNLTILETITSFSLHTFIIMSKKWHRVARILLKPVLLALSGIHTHQEVYTYMYTYPPIYRYLHVCIHTISLWQSWQMSQNNHLHHVTTHYWQPSIRSPKHQRLARLLSYNFFPPKLVFFLHCPNLPKCWPCLSLGRMPNLIPRRPKTKL